MYCPPIENIWSDFLCVCMCEGAVLWLLPLTSAPNLFVKDSVVFLYYCGFVFPSISTFLGSHTVRISAVRDAIPSFIIGEFFIFFLYQQSQCFTSPTQWMRQVWFNYWRLSILCMLATQNFGEIIQQNYEKDE